MEAEEATVLVERFGQCAILTLNRPEKLNAMNLRMHEELLAAIDAVHDRRAVVLTGAGTRAFTAGNDLAEAASATGGRSYAASFAGMLYRAMEAIRCHSAAFIAAVNGYALGGGTGLVNACDLALASADAEFGIPQIGFGAFPGAGAPMVKGVGSKAAALDILTAYRFDGRAALRQGLVNEVVPSYRLRSRARELAESIAGTGADRIAEAKRTLRTAVELTWEQALESEMGCLNKVRSGCC
jgi:enoyl-CoA hydratase/carnithine racemase